MTSSTRPADPVDLQALDWRFLLPRPTADRVALVNPAGDRLRASVPKIGTAVTEGTVAELAHADDAPWDLVVVSTASARALSEAAALVAPGGWLYAELPPRAGMAGGLARLEREVAMSGLTAVRAHWHWPSVARSTRIVPATHPAGAGAPLRRQLGRPLRGPERLVAPFVDRLGAIELLGGQLSIVAARDPVGDAAWMVLQPIATELRRELGADSPSWTLLTPRFHASAHVILLLADRDDATKLVAKIARAPGSSPSLGREAENLTALSGTAASGSVPRLLTTAQVFGHQVLVEHALSGAALDPRTVRRDPPGWIGRVRQWLATLPATARASSADVERLLHAPLRRFADAHPGRDGRNHRLVEETLAHLDVLRQAGLPLVYEHGDLSHPNLLVDEDGRVTVLDWELGRPDGLPLHDLTYFLAYLAKSVSRPRHPDDLPGAFRGLVADPSTGARDALRAELARLLVAPEHGVALVTACWARTVAGLAERIGAGPDGEDGWLVGNRYYLLWEDALRYRDELHRAFS